MSKKILKKKNNLIVNKYLPYLENIISSLTDFTENTDFSEMRTNEHKLRLKMENQFNNTNEDEILTAFIELLKNINLGVYSKEIKREIKNEVKEKSEKDIRFKEFFNLVSKVEKLHPNISFFVFFRTNPIEEYAKAFESYDLIYDFKKYKGEKAARNAVRIYREVAEMLYDNYIRVISEFVALLEGKEVIKSHQNFGVLVAQLPQKLVKFECNNLIDADAGWLRNATCHAHWIYIPETDKIKLWDKTKPEKEFTSTELFEMAMNMYSMVIEVYMSIIPIYFKSKFFNELLPMIKYIQMNFNSLFEGSELHQTFIDKIVQKNFEAVTKIEFKRINT